jgi:hypothetical protein
MRDASRQHNRLKYIPENSREHGETNNSYGERHRHYGSIMKARRRGLADV